MKNDLSHIIQELINNGELDLHHLADMPEEYITCLKFSIRISSLLNTVILDVEHFASGHHPGGSISMTFFNLSFINPRNAFGILYENA